MESLVADFAQQYELDQKFLQSVLCVESSGARPFGYNNYPILRFELHEFARRASNQEDASKISYYFAFGKNKNLQHYYVFDNVYADIHSSQENEVIALTIARTINEKAALESTSYGVAQIMGFNHKRVGYASVKEMYEASFLPENQYRMFFNFITTNKSLLEAIKNQDIESFIKMYNGPGLIELYKKKFLRCMESSKA